MPIKREDAVATVPPRVPAAEEYLNCMQVLISELQRSMIAISRNELFEYEDSVATQQALCGRLALLKARAEAAASSRLEVEPRLASRIFGARQTLLDLNRRYAALLKHQNETMQLLGTLVRSYTGTMNVPAGLRTDFHTWSCHL